MGNSTTFKQQQANVIPPLYPLVSNDAVELIQLTFVSMNLAGCQPSQEAPIHWTRDTATKAIQCEVMGNNPDVLALQECPGGAAWASKVFPGYQAIGSKRSHADHVILLVRNGIEGQLVPQDDSDLSTPIVLAELRHKERRLFVASVHLAPFREGSVRRTMQVQSLLDKVTTASFSTTPIAPAPLIFAGDTNMRDEEDTVMENQLELVDAWKASGSDPQTRFTWDTNDHTKLFYARGSFNRYYGKSTRQYNARYDRVYCKIPATMTVEVSSFHLIANQPVTSKYHFLSDHFGISTVLKFNWGD